MRPAMQAAGEYVAATGRSSEGSVERSGFENVDRLLDALADAWAAAAGFALEHPAVAVVTVLVVVLIAERLLARRSWRF